MFKKNRELWIHGEQLERAAMIFDMVKAPMNVGTAEVQNPRIFKVTFKAKNNVYADLIRKLNKYGVTIFN